MRKRLPYLLVLGLALLTACGSPPAAPRLRVGYFPNVTHAQAVIGFADGTFQRAVGPGVTLETKLFHAGPYAVEALFAGELDLAYIGPSPAVNGYIKSKGKAFRIVAGAASGGAVLVVQPGLAVRSPRDLEGKRVASPQLGNTQDVALRHYLQSGGLKPADRGGTVKLSSAAGADIFALFAKKELDAAWVPEPWGARLVQEAGGVVAVDERDLWPGRQFATTVIIASVKALNEHPEAVQAFLGAHVDLTRWIAAHPDEARARLNSSLAGLTGKRLRDSVLQEALTRVNFDYAVPAQSVVTMARRAYDLGFLGKQEPELQGLFDLTALNAALQARGLPPAAPG